MRLRNLLVFAFVLLQAGCVGHYPNAGHGDVLDAVFHRRHPEHEAHYAFDPFMQVARQVTMIEDDLRQDGTITVKRPDVWGDGNLLHYIQEYDREMARNLDSRFTETLSAYIARSDLMELQADAAMAQSLSGGDAPAATASTSVTVTPPQNLYSELKAAVMSLPTGTDAKPKIGVEPTELDRQRSVFLQANQALRRRMIGDDQTRAAGYGLYMFRIPVSVLPGRETHRNHAAVVNIRAKLEVDGSHLHYTYPKLVIADLVDTLAPVIIADWGCSTNFEPTRTALATFLHEDSTLDSDRRDELERVLKQFDDNPVGAYRALLAAIDYDPEKKGPSRAEFRAAPGWRLNAVINRQMAAPPSPVNPSLPDVNQVYGHQAVFHLRLKAQENFSGMAVSLKENGVPRMQEVRAFLFQYLAQVNNALEQTQAAQNMYSGSNAQLILSTAESIEKGHFKAAGASRDAWQQKLPKTQIDADYLAVAPLLAIQTGILDRNLKKILEQLQREGKLTDEVAAILSDCKHPQPGQPAETQLRFFGLDESYPLTASAVECWRTIIRENFPLHVFALEPHVEEQNVFDAFSRARELQLALAYNVAKGTFNTQNKIQMSRQLTLQMADIALNRTAVSFAHGEDTFGWYFYPRVQSPPVESSNVAALARMLWSTGPTEHYDTKHRNLEPGIRECEVLIAMPSFVTGVAFDVTTNWERLTKPGVTKRSYEEMVAQGGRIHRLKTYLGEIPNQACYRPGEAERIYSRIEQLEQMLGMQTHRVNVPYEFEQSGLELFDTGKNQLRPVLTGFYGLDQLALSANDGTVNGNFFITGKNFHPTLTHVIVGGTESHSVASSGPASESRPAAAAAAPPVQVTVNTVAPASGGGQQTTSQAPSSPEVEVINRELIRVRVNKLSPVLSVIKTKTENGEQVVESGGFTVRVGTPAGMSNPLFVKSGPVFKAPSPAPAATANKLEAEIKGTVTLVNPTPAPKPAGKKEGEQSAILPNQLRPEQQDELPPPESAPTSPARPLPTSIELLPAR